MLALTGNTGAANTLLTACTSLNTRLMAAASPLTSPICTTKYCPPPWVAMLAMSCSYSGLVPSLRMMV
ncbi:hypothetical protein D3C71_2180870 [compost metagenome]